MAIRVRRQTNVSKKTTLLHGIDVGPPNQRVCWRNLNRSVHEALNNISKVKVHFTTGSENINIVEMTSYQHRCSVVPVHRLDITPFFVNCVAARLLYVATASVMHIWTILEIHPMLRKLI